MPLLDRKCELHLLHCQTQLINPNLLKLFCSIGFKQLKCIERDNYIHPKLNISITKFPYKEIYNLKKNWAHKFKIKYCK